MFVTFEGIDGSGKSTAMRAVAEAWDGPCWSTAEETPYLGTAVRRSISQRMDPFVTTYLFLGDRFAHIPEIRRHLDAGETVFCDRFMHSTLAYQGVTLAQRMDDPMAWLRAMHGPMPLRPDRVLWFDVAPETAIARATERGETAPYEKVEFLQAVADNYCLLAEAETERITRIDASQAPGKVAADALAALVKS